MLQSSTHRFWPLVVWVLLLSIGPSPLWAQRLRKPERAIPPKFTGQEFEGTFFSDLSSVLQGPRPTLSPSTTPSTAAAAASASTSASGGNAAGDSWPKLISSATIEDMVKNSKLRLDQIVATPTKFAGGYKDARREFSLQALLFAIIEQYPSEVRWKKSAPVAREALARMAANSKVSSPQAFKEAKQRVQDLSDLLNGSTLEGTPSSELDWGDVIDRVPLMQLLEWAQQQHINGFVASPANFSQHKDELQRFAELVAALGKAAIMEDMPDAADAEYRAISQQMIEQSQQISLAVQTDNADLARTAAGKIGQSCAKCHEGYR